MSENRSYAVSGTPLIAHRRLYSGFTLIELLVVIGIIAILSAILFPVFAKAREKARQTTCMNNQRQIAMAILLYAQDHDEMLPLSETVWKNDTLHRQVLQCQNAGTLVANAYVYNDSLSGMALGDIQEPPAMLLIGDGQHDATKAAGTYDNIAYSGVDFAMRHNRMCIAAYLDGHVQLTTALGACAPVASFSADSGVMPASVDANGIKMLGWQMLGAPSIQFYMASVAVQPRWRPTGLNGEAWVEFDGVANRMDCKQAVLNITTNTMVALFATTNPDGGLFGQYFGCNMGLSGGKVWHYYVNSTISGYNQLGGLKSPLTYNDGKPHVAVTTAGPAGTAIYVDGTLVASQPKPMKLTGGEYVNQLQVGHLGFLYFKGFVGAVRWYNQVLSQDDIAIISRQLLEKYAL